MKPFFSFAWAFFLTNLAWAFETPVTEFVITTESVDQALVAQDFNQRLYSRLTTLDQKGTVGFRYHPAEELGGLIRSSLEAVQASEIQGWELLIYGQVVQKDTSVDVELRIYSHVDRSVIRTILLRSTVEDYDQLVSDTAQKIFDTLVRLLSIDEGKTPAITEKNAWITGQSAFWWGTAPPWSEVLVPIAGYRGSYSVRLGDPIWSNGDWGWFQDWGGYASLLFALGSPSRIPSQTYGAEFGPMAGWALVGQRQQELFGTAALAARFQLLDSVPHYGDERWTSSLWYGGRVVLGYRIWVDPQRTFALGLEGAVSTFVVDPWFTEYQLGISVLWKGVFS